jgi:high-affinity iron transporter
VTWADSVPNLLIGLREGLEAGLVVSILLAAVRKAAATRGATAPVWLGVLGAVTLSASFAAVLTFSTSALSSQAQEALGGVLSVLAVGLVTAMIFWMRRTAAGLSARLTGEVARAAVLGAGALTVTAFLAVGREGLETTLFLWTAAKASGQTAAPLLGAAAGIAAAVVLCWLLYRRAVRLNVGVFFTRTAIALIVIAAGVLAYGLGDLQDAGLLPGQRWIAFDLSPHIDPGSWWASIITGVTDLAPKMTVLQVVAWVTYLAVVIHVTAGTMIAALPAASDAAAATLSVTRTGCAPEWTAAQSGTQTFTIDNQSGLAGEINLDDASGAVLGEIETIGPGTSAPLTATLGSGTYSFKCFMGSQPVTASQPVQVTSGAANPAGAAPVAVKPVTVAELTSPNNEYQAYAARQLGDLATDVARIEADLGSHDVGAAQRDWLAAQLNWERVGASYDSFGDLGLAVDGLPDGLVNGVNDANFTGLHRLEYGLWHGQGAATLLPVAQALARNVATVQQNLGSHDLAGDPANLPVRAHEILEDALRDHLSGIDDQGGDGAFALTYADAQVTGAVLGYLTPLINARQPGLAATAQSQLGTLRQALLATRVDGQWQSLSAASGRARANVDAAIGAVLETVASVPDLLEVPPTH